MKPEKKQIYKQKALELVSKMTLEEKAGQMLYNAPAIPRLGIPFYNWWNEALHGVARAGTATVFPQAIGLAAMFDSETLHKTADIISTEGRVKYNLFKEEDDRDIYKGLTFWSPNINIFRDPRWGRGHETYGEDPFLSAELGKAFVKGLQGDDEDFLKSAACAKHFAVHSGPESVRHSFNVEIGMQDLYETYLYAFKELCDDGVEGFMGAYNAVNGEPCCGSKTLLDDILRRDWGFDGYVTSDCGALRDFNEHHKVTKTVNESVALAVKNGCDLNCGAMYCHILSAINEGLICEEDIDKCVTRLMETRLRLGILGDVQTQYDSLDYPLLCCDKHIESALDTAKKSMVLLENDGILPLDRSKTKSIAVIGPNADSRLSLIGNYHGTADRYVTALEGIQDYVGKDVRINYAVGCDIFSDKTEGLALPDDRISEAVIAAKHSDVVMLCLGLNELLEGEEGDANNFSASGDKENLSLPVVQQKLLDRVLAVGKPTVVVLFSGSALAVEDSRINALIQAWYPGQQGGTALSEILFGDFSPCGKLPVTFYKSCDDLPSFTDYDMNGRTYRYFEKEALYPFGFGLSYASFEYSNLTVSDSDIANGESVTVSVNIKNTSNIDAWEKSQLYISFDDRTNDLPIRSLKGFRAVFLKANEQKTINFNLQSNAFGLFDQDGKLKLNSGNYTIHVGGSQPDDKSVKLLEKSPLTIKVNI